MKVERVAIRTYEGSCDASAGVWVGGQLIVANDEDNVLRFYGAEARTVRETADLDRVLDVTGGNPEADIEAVTQMGGLTYWVTSHARNRNGKARPNRHRLWSMTLTAGPGRVEMVGFPYKDLLVSLRGPLRDLGIAYRDVEPLAPEEGGINIEALFARDEVLLLGFRSPLTSEGRAIVLPLTNAPQVVRSGEAPRYLPAIALDLGGLGLRGGERVGDEYLLIAGSVGEGRRFQLFQWSGKATDVPRRLAFDFSRDGVSPEDVIVHPDGHTVFFLSDDGGRDVKGRSCKELDATSRRFRVLEARVDRA